MKDGPDTVQGNPQPRPTTFRKLSTKCKQQALDVLPCDTRARWLKIDCFERTPMPALHTTMISQYDIGVKIAWIRAVSRLTASS